MAFKSYCWVIGTTSFRVKQLSYKNELQLQYLSELFLRNPEKEWRSLQEKYYDLLVDKGFSKGTANNKAKDARELTSGLADLGLVYRNTRQITTVGDSINQIRRKADFSSDNALEISPDSYVYLRQFLKLQINNKTIKIRPFVSFIYLLAKLGKLSRNEFTYLLPTCLTTSDVVTLITNLRGGGLKSIDDILKNKILTMDNYKETLNVFLNNEEFDEYSFSKLGMNRKSSNYDKPVFYIYSNLKDIWENRNRLSTNQKIVLINLLNKSLEKINNNQQGPWRKLFNLTKQRKIDDEYLKWFFALPLLQAGNLNDFKKAFFLEWHLMKWKKTLEDYYDLNKRYFLLTDVIEYSREEFKLTETGYLYFKDIIDKIFFSPLLKEKEYGEIFTNLVPIESIYPECNKTKDDMAKLISEEVGKTISPKMLSLYLKETRNQKLLSFIDEKFPKNVLSELLDCFKNRNDEKIFELVTDEATPSTCFEYIIAIIWFEISGRKGFLEDYMNLTLNSNLLPKTHASGGESDIIFNYENNSDYPKHDLLIEVTLNESTGQRESEWEPVTRHLENHIIESNNKKDYVVFIAGNLTTRAISVFRNMKTYDYYSPKGLLAGTGLKIIPLDCDLMKNILDKSMTYNEIYKIFDDSYHSLLNGIEWYEKTIKEKI